MASASTTQKLAKVKRPWREVEDEDADDSGTFQNLPVHQALCNAGQFLSKVLTTPCSPVAAAMSENYLRLLTQTMFRSSQQAIAALIANAIDACSQGPKIGRFGMGFSSMFYLLTQFADIVITVKTKSSSSPFEYTMLFHSQESNPVVSLSRDRKERPPGTSVVVKKNEGTFLDLAAEMEKVVLIFGQCIDAAIMFHGIQLNPKANRANGTVEVTVEPTIFSVVDNGVGMSLRELQKLLAPRMPNKEIHALPEESPEVEVAFDKAFRQVFFGLYVNRVLVKAFTFRGQKNGVKSMIFLPAATRLPSSRDNVLLSDAHTFSCMKQAVEQLIGMHAKRGSVVDLRKFLVQLANESHQTNGFSLLRYFDKTLLESDLLLAPANDVMVNFLTKRFEIKSVASDLFNSKKLEDAILERASGQVPIVKSVLSARIVLYVEMVERDFLISPHLCRLVVFRSGLPDDCVSNFYNVDRHLSRSNQTYTIDKVIARKFESLQSSLRSRTIEAHQTRVLQTWFAHYVCLPRFHMFRMIFPNFLTLWERASIPEALFFETLASLQASLVKSRVRAMPYAGGPIKWRIHDFNFRHESEARVENRVFVHPALSRLELSLMQFKISIFPCLPDGEMIVCFYRNKSKTSSFTELVDVLLSNGLQEGAMKSILDAAEIQAAHVVEAFLALFIFCEFALDKDSLNLARFTDAFCSECLLCFITAMRKSASLETLLRLFTRALAGAAHDASVLRIMVIEPAMRSFSVLQGVPDDGFLRAHEHAMAIVQEPKDDEISQHTFTANDLIAFVLEGGFKTNIEFMDPATLSALAAFALKNPRRMRTQSVVIEVNFGTTQDPVTDATRELFQRALASKQVVHIGVDSQNICMFDFAGIPETNLLHVLLPLSDPNEGGSNFLFAAMRQPLCDHVTITTVSDNFWCEVIATPVIEAELVVDVALQMRVCRPRAVKQHGTYVQVATRDSAEQQARLEFESMCGFGEIPVMLNGQSISIASSMIFKKPKMMSLAIMNKETSKPSVVLVGGFPYAQLLPFWESHFAPVESDRVWLSLFCTNVIIDIDLSQVQHYRRGRFAFKSLSRLKAILQEAAFVWKIFTYGESLPDGKVEDSLDAFRNEMVPRSTARSSFRNSHDISDMFFNFQETKFPRSIQQLRQSINTIAYQVIDRCLGDHNDKESEYLIAQRIVSRLRIDQMFKQAILTWFRPKNTTCDGRSLDYKDPDPDPDYALDKEEHSDEEFSGDPTGGRYMISFEIFSAFGNAYFECLNLALAKGHKIIEVETNFEFEKLAHPPTFVYVNQQMLGVAHYNKEDHQVVFTQNIDTVRLCVAIERKCKSLKDKDELTTERKADDLMEWLKQTAPNVFFYARGSYENAATLHELIHAYESSQIQHPSLRVIDKDYGVVNTDGSYNAAVIAIEKWVIEAGFAKNLLQKLMYVLF